MAAKIKKGDRVFVLTGRDKGKRGEVIRVLRDEDRVVVQGINMVKRHTRPSAANAGGIVEQEAPIHVSNVAHVDPKDDKPTRVGFKIIEADRKVRYAKRSGEIIDR
jgi:large subunit ribosomal protein L24